MRILIRIDENNEVISTHFDPDSLSEAELVGGILIERDIPRPELVNGKLPILHYSMDTNEFYYLHIDSLEPKKQPTEIELLQQDVGSIILDNAMKEARIIELGTSQGNLLIDQAMDKMKIVEMEKSQGDLLMEVAMLKMGGSL